MCSRGFTICPGAAARDHMYKYLRQLAAEAAAAGLPFVVWSYPCGSGPSDSSACSRHGANAKALPDTTHSPGQPALVTLVPRFTIFRPLF